MTQKIWSYRFKRKDDIWEIFIQDNQGKKGLQEGGNGQLFYFLETRYTSWHLFYFCFLSRLHGLWDLSSPIRDQNPCSLQWKHRVLTIGPLGTSLVSCLNVDEKLKGWWPQINIGLNSVEVTGDIDRSDFSGILGEKLTGKNIRENEKKKVETVSIETFEEICHKKK